VPSGTRSIDGLRDVTEMVEAGVAQGHHLGAQVCASIHGRPVLDLAVGEARPGVRLTRDTCVIWKSSTKPIIAAAVMQCVERGELRIEDKVASHLPAFGRGGKEAITIRHLLTHTAGFRDEPFDFPDDPWQTIIDAICAMPMEPGWEPGQSAGYHPTTSWFILGELLQRATGEYLPDLLRQSVFEPMGMPDCHVGLACHVYEDLVSGGRLASLPDTSDGSAEDTVHTREWLTHCSPGSSGVGPMRQLARFYEAMLRRGQADGRHVLSPDSVAQMIGRQRAGLRDRTFAYAMDWGLGVVLDKPGRRGRMPYGYGRHASPDTFGHGGVQSSVGFADPAHGLAVGVAFVGMPGERIHQHRIDTLLTTLYEELGLV